MKNSDELELKQYPVPPKYVFRTMLLAILVLAITAGYFQSRFDLWNTNNMRILQKFNVNTTKELLEKHVEVK